MSSFTLFDEKRTPSWASLTGNSVCFAPHEAHNLMQYQLGLGRLQVVVKLREAAFWTVFFSFFFFLLRQIDETALRPCECLCAGHQSSSRIKSPAVTTAMDVLLVSVSLFPPPSPGGCLHVQHEDVLHS